MRREVFETPEFTEQLGRIDNVKRLDERLEGLTWALWLDAEDFPLVVEGNRLRIAELRGFGVEPTLSVWFEIDGGNVILRWIEPTEGDEPEA